MKFEMYCFVKERGIDYTPRTNCTSKPNFKIMQLHLMNGIRIFSSTISAILAADVTTSSEPRLKIRKGKYWVRESINLRFLKPPIVSNSCFANWEQKATSGYSFICCYFNKFSNQPELYFLLNPL